MDWAVPKHQTGAEEATQVLTAPLLPPSLPWPQAACAPPQPRVPLLPADTFALVAFTFDH